MLEKIISLIENSPSSFNGAKNIKEELISRGYKKITFNESIEKGGKYYIEKNESCILAFNIGENLANPYFNIVASHLDCPSFKIKPNPVIKANGYCKLNVEGYGGMIMSTWLDKPLGIAGRVAYKKDGKIVTEIINIDEAVCSIPNVAIHMNREVNKGYAFNIKDDMLPIISLNEDFDFYKFLTVKTGIKEKILSYDLFLYPVYKALIWGEDKEFISSFHIDDFACASTSLYAFIDNFSKNAINIYASFDNEEIGSLTKQGADSNFLYDILKYISKELGLEYVAMLEKSLSLSADNAHALHPNHPEYYDISNRAYLNKGIVIKYSARQSYASDSLGSAIFIDILEKENIPYQFFTNRSDMPGGSTLGNISNSHVSIDTVDIGLAQLAMHSNMEMAGSKDFIYMYEALKAFYRR